MWSIGDQVCDQLTYLPPSAGFLLHRRLWGIATSRPGLGWCHRCHDHLPQEQQSLTKSNKGSICVTCFICGCDAYTYLILTYEKTEACIADDCCFAGDVHLLEDEQLQAAVLDSMQLEEKGKTPIMQGFNLLPAFKLQTAMNL